MVSSTQNPENMQLDTSVLLAQGDGTNPLWISEEQIKAHADYSLISDSLESALKEGLDPAADLPRTAQNLAYGQFLLMPSQYGDFAGVKVASVAPDNPDKGRRRIQGIYILMDSATLTPLALIDGAALTLLRTAAVSLTAARHLAPTDVRHLAVFGSGPQAAAHIEALKTIFNPAQISIVGRNRQRAQALADSITWTNAQVADAQCVGDAQVIICATSADMPVFDGSLVTGDRLIIAVGSHEPDKREVDSALMQNSQVVVEDEATAIRESGDLVIPLDEGVVSSESLISLRDLVADGVLVDRTRPRVFTSTGMSWQDVIASSAIIDQMRDAIGADPV